MPTGSNDPRDRPDIAILVPTLEIGGAERVSVVLANALVAAGVKVDLVTGRAVGDLVAEVDPRVRCVDLGARRFRWSVVPWARYARSRRPRAVLAMMQQSALVAVIGQMLTGQPERLVVSERSTPSQRRVAGRIYGWERGMHRLLRTVYARADAVVVPSEGVRDDLRHAFGIAQAQVIANPIDTDGVRRAATAPIDLPWDPRPELLIVSVGRLVASKGLDDLIVAVAQAREVADARLVVVGDGPERAGLEQQARELGCGEAIAFVGPRTNPYPWLAAADVVASASRLEGFPNVLVEALALGRLVVATDCPSGPREVLDGGRVGRLTPVDDPPALAAAILEEWREPSAPPADRLARAETWSASVIAARYLEVLLG